MLRDRHSHRAFIREDIRLDPAGQGPLAGRTFAVKDVFAVAGHTNAAGNPDWLRTHEAAGEHAEAVKRLAQAGAALEGMTHTDELMYSLSGENVHYGTPMNPDAPGRIPGGSSSGSAVAVASGAVDFALGTDTGGSVRVPAAYCGVYGFRPTHGLVPEAGVIPLAKSFDTVGWFARSARLLREVGEVLLGAPGQGNADGGMLGGDAERGHAGRGMLGGSAERGPADGGMLVGSAERGPADGGMLVGDAERGPADGGMLVGDAERGPADGGMLVGSAERGHADGGMLVGDAERGPAGRSSAAFRRLILAEDAWMLADSATVPALEGALEQLKTGGALTLETLRLSQEGLQPWMDTFRLLQGLEIWQEHGEWIQTERPAFAPDIQARLDWASTLKPEDAEPARQARDQFTLRLEQLLGGDGLLVMPTTPGPAPILQAEPEEVHASRLKLLQLTCIAGLSGLPQLTIPVRGGDGLPVGLSLLAGRGRDSALLHWAEQRMEGVQSR